MAPKKVRRRPWSTAEKEAVWRQLGVHVLFQSVPGKEVCQRCLDQEPVLRGRHWKDIKNQVHNQIQSQKKQQFHAQMDLQGNQEQQDQIQNQKKQQHQQQQYQAPMDQQGKDHSQNQKKQQCHQQINQHNQDNSQNQKKQQYHTQVEDENHLQIHKKQLCHTRLEHQDHVQVHKKQLYQMDQPTQGLQTTLDRDTSLLTATPYGSDGPHRGPGHPLVERDPIISPYPLSHRAPGPHMDQLLGRTVWTDESLVQNYPISRHLTRNLLEEVPPGASLPNPHSGYVHF